MVTSHAIAGGHHPDGLAKAPSVFHAFGRKMCCHSELAMSICGKSYRDDERSIIETSPQ